MIDPRMQAVIASVFNVPAEQITASASAGELANWTSLGHLELMLAIEAEFGLRIPAEKMLELTSAESIESYLRSQGALR
jgi:acyl carrier protein